MSARPDAPGSAGRAGAMARSLAAAVRGAGFGSPEVGVVGRAHALAMGPRLEQLADDHHPAYLHPGRSALILLHDVYPIDVTVLVLATLLESIDVSLRVPAERIEAEVGPSAVAALAEVPGPGDERLVERLVGLGPGVARVALAERLDHLRHLHLREDLIDSWAGAHAEVAAAWLPFAARTDKKLAIRYAHWVRTFAKRI